MKIWYDITGLYSWSGNFTGIQRVIYSLGKYLHEDKSRDAGFFIFRQGRFVEVSWTELENKLENTKKNKLKPNNKATINRAHLQHRSMLLAKRLARESVLEKPLRKVYGGARSTYRYMAGYKNLKAGNQLFKSSDTVIVVDGNWLFPGFAEAIRTTKKSADYKFIHFVNDIVAIKNPALASEGADKIIGDYFKKILPITDTVMCISESTKRDVSKILFGYIKDADIRVIKLGSDIPNAKSIKKPRIKIPKDFILSVSTVEVRKNYLLMYYVYKQSLVENRNLPNLIIVGKKGWMVEDVYNLITKDPDVNKKITILNGVSDEELEWLYTNCKLTVFPSFYEGWGIPIAESLARGKLCISSNTSSMPEVGKGLVRYLSPFDPQAWLEEISSLLDGKELSKLEEKIKQSYSATSWKDTYNDLINYI